MYGRIYVCLLLFRFISRFIVRVETFGFQSRSKSLLFQFQQQLQMVVHICLYIYTTFGLCKYVYFTLPIYIFTYCVDVYMYLSDKAYSSFDGLYLHSSYPVIF